jgi:hypothetical protein
MTVNRDTARRYTTRAQVAFIALLVGAGAVAALPLPMLRPAASPAAVTVPGPAAPAEAPDQEPAQPVMDLVRATSKLWDTLPPSAEPAPDPASTPIVDGTTKPAPDQPDSVPPGDWRYIGSIVGPRGMHAIMEREGRQKLAKVGDEFDSVRIVAIEAGKVTIDEGAGSKEIKLSPRASRWDASRAASAVPIPATPRNNPNRAGIAAPRPPAVPPQRNPYAEMNDEEREKYEAQKLERYREAGEAEGLEKPDGGKR